VQEARKDFQDFLEAIKSSRDLQWVQLRENAKQWVRELPQAEPPPPRVSVGFVPAPEPPAPEPKVEPPRVSVGFVPAPEPDFHSLATGTFADYLLHRRLLDLKLAQNFEDLICLASLDGVDTYHYQQETVRRVLRHFKGRALLADEVGLGKTIEACLILKEYWMRGMVSRALVLTPPALVQQWKAELVEKFGLTPASPDDSSFRSDLAAGASGGGLDRHGAPGAARLGAGRGGLGCRDRRRGALSEESRQRELEVGELADQEVHSDVDGHAGGEQPDRAV
jgi:hypothetical protein